MGASPSPESQSSHALLGHPQLPGLINHFRSQLAEGRVTGEVSRGGKPGVLGVVVWSENLREGGQRAQELVRAGSQGSN